MVDQTSDQDTAGPDASESPEHDADDPQAEIGRLNDENARLKDQAMRALAEAENTRRRAQRDKEDTAKFAVSSIARDILDVADNLRRALEAVPPDKIQADDTTNTLVEGVAATEKMLLDTFERHGISRLDPLDEKFDPNYHQAMMEVPNSGKPAGTVVQVLAPGYIIHGRLLRAAMVAVAAGDQPQTVDTTA